MKAPHHEREDLLCTAIHRATEELIAPIDRIEVTAKRVHCWAGSRQVSFSYAYAQGGRVDSDGRFQPSPGSGSWDLALVSEPGILRGTFGKFLARLRKDRAS